MALYNADLNVSGTLTVPSGIFSDSVTVSGAAVLTSDSPVGGGGSALTVKEADGSPSVANVDTIVVSDGTLTDDGSGQVTISTGGTGGSGGGELTTSGSWYNPHVKPANVHPKSDWFDDNSGQVVIDSLPSGTHYIDTTKWTLWDVDAVSGTNNGHTQTSVAGDDNGTLTFDTNNMLVHHDASTAQGWVGWYQDAPAGSFTITARVGVDSTFNNNSDFRIGIFIADDLAGSPSTSDLITCSLNSVISQTTLTNYSQIQGALWTDYNSISTNGVTTASPFPGNSAWVRIDYNSSSTRTECVISEDGINWRELFRFNTITFTPSHIGIGMQVGIGGATSGSFEFFSVYPGVSRGRPAGHGRLLPTITDAVTGGGGGSGDGTITSINTDAVGPAVTITGVGGIHTITEGNVITVSGANDILVDSSFNNLFHAEDIWASTTGQQGFTASTWTTRRLNTLSTDRVTGASLVSNQITLPPGTYYTEWNAPAYNVSHHKTRLRDIDNSVNIMVGTNAFTANTDFVMTNSVGSGRFTLTESTTLELQHHCSVTNGTNGLSAANNITSTDERYAEIRIWSVQHAGAFVEELTVASGTFTESLTISGVPVSTGTGGGSANTLQDAYDNGDGVITTTAGKPLHISGDEYDGNVDFQVTGSGKFTESLQVGSGTVFIDSDKVQTPSLFVGGSQILPTTDYSVVNGFAGATIKIDVPQAVITSTNHPIAWESVLVDTGEWVNLGNDDTIFTVPEGLGVTHVRLTAYVNWQPSALANRRLVAFLKNGTTDIGNGVVIRNAVLKDDGGGAPHHHLISPIVSASPGDTFSAFVWHDHGSDLNIQDGTANSSTWFSIEQANPIAVSGTNFTSISGSFTDSLTVSGVPVNIGAGGGAGTLTDINVTATGPSVTITGVGSISTITEGNTITVSSSVLSAKPTFRGARVSLAVDQAVTTSTTHHLLYDTTEFDTEGFVVGGDESEFIIPAGVTKVRLRAMCFWENVATGNRQISIRHTGQPGSNAGSTDTRTEAGASATFTSTYVQDVTPGQDFSVAVTQTAGVDVDILGIPVINWFEIEVIESDQSWEVDEFTAVSGTFSESLTISGVPVSTGTGGGASTLQEAYDGGDGIITTGGGKPLELDGTGEIVAVTGTFSEGITIGTASTHINDHLIVTTSGVFDTVFVDGVPIVPGTATDGAFRGCLLNRISQQEVLTATSTPITWTDVIVDTANFWNAGLPQRITIPAGITKVRFSAQGDFEYHGSTTGRSMYIGRNGGAYSNTNLPFTSFASNPTASNAAGMNLSSGVVEVEEGDYFEVFVKQDSGTTLDFNVSTTTSRSWFMLEILEPNNSFGLLQDDSFKNLFHVQDRKAVNTPGGTFTQTAFQTRDLNTVLSSGIKGAYLDTNQIFLPPGTYYAEFSAPAFDVGRHKSYFYDVDNPEVLIQGSSEIADTTGNVGNSSFGSGRFTIDHTANIEIRHRCQVTKTTSGFGLESNHNSFDELYTDVRIWPIDETGTSLNNLTVVSGTFTQSLTVSGVPVNIGAGGGSSSIDDINGISTGSVVITGTGGVETITEGNTITVSGSHGTRWDPLMPPASGVPGSDEFYPVGPVASGGGGLWTQWDPGGWDIGSDTHGGMLMLAATDIDSDGAKFHGIVQANPIDTYNVWTKVSLTPYGTFDPGHHTYGGIVFAQNAISSPTTSDFIFFGLHQDGDTSVIEVSQFTDWNDAAPTILAEVRDEPNSPLTSIYLRATRNSSDGCTYMISQDGIGWRRIYSHTASFTIVDVGLAHSNNTATPGSVAYFQFFRVLSGNEFNGILEGNFL